MSPCVSNVAMSVFTRLFDLHTKVCHHSLLTSSEMQDYDCIYPVIQLQCRCEAVYVLQLMFSKKQCDIAFSLALSNNVTVTSSLFGTSKVMLCTEPYLKNVKLFSAMVLFHFHPNKSMLWVKLARDWERSLTWSCNPGKEISLLFVCLWDTADAEIKVPSAVE